MEDRRLAVHRTIVVVDVEGFGDRRRTNRHQVAVREGLYGAMQEAFRRAGVPWDGCGVEDRGDGVLILVPAEVPKSLFVESLPSALATALHAHNDAHTGQERIRLRMALHAGEVNYDDHGVTAASINLAFRLVDSDGLKAALAGSSGVLAIIASSWFFEEVVRHSAIDPAAYRPVRVHVKETSTSGWIFLPDRMHEPDDPARERRPAVTSVPDRLALVYRAALNRPITPAGEIPAELQIPTLGQGYIDHRIRVAEVGASAAPSRESWWHGIPLYGESENFFAEYLTSPKALAAPLILLGQPGSGKSVLTKKLAARLPSRRFLPVRVELRQVPAEIDLQDQIEFAVRHVTGERVPWPKLVESANGALPVVILDGFDELLQAGGTAHLDFLPRVQAFQERESDMARPLAVIVTSRIAVMDYALIPHGSVVVRLEPFDKDQIAAWLEVWQRFNSAPLARRGMRPLPASMALTYKELAEQPLLLLMLALYDADANVLQRRSAELGQTELYGRLLYEFARREIRKRASSLAEADLESAVEAELHRLSIVAFAMFNRRSQWASGAELDSDLSILLHTGEQRPRSGGPHAPLTSAQQAIGGFFFIHESQAIRDNGRLHTYEFLHATFGEFLVARLVIRVLAGMLPRQQDAGTFPPHGADDGLLHALLSFAALASRGPIVGFLADLIGQMETGQRGALAQLTLRLHARALYARAESNLSGYEPLALTVTARHAAWSANLVVLAVLAAGEMTGAQLFPDDPDPAWAWRNEAMIWRSQLGGQGWQGLHATIALERVWDGKRREIRVWRNDGTFVPPALDLHWTYRIPPGSHTDRSRVYVDQYYRSSIPHRKINFACNLSEDVMNSSLHPIDSPFPLVGVFVTLDTGRAVQAAHALLQAIAAPYEDGPSRAASYLDLAHVVCELAQAATVKREYDTYLKAALAVLVSAAEGNLASRESLQPLARITGGSIRADPQLAELLIRVDVLLSDHAPGTSGNGT